MNGRAKHLDGLRAFSILAICWDHWSPHHWPRIFPFEIFLFFFLVMTGFLITGSLLREREKEEATGKAWKWRALKNYQLRRGLRILVPYYAALLLAGIIAPDVWISPFSYLLHISNIHIAFLGFWPQGTNHFWSLAMQQQFYLLWPFVIWWLPRRLLLGTILLISCVGPATRFFHDEIGAWLACPWPQTLTWTALDYFGIGALFALLKNRGLTLESPLLKIFPLAGLACYLFIFLSHHQGLETHGLRFLQQTFLSIALCGLLAWAIRGFPHWIGRFLEWPFFQKIGEKSYGIYLYHNLAPLLAGKICFFLWFPPFAPPAVIPLQIASFAFFTWLLTEASWRWIEKPMQHRRDALLDKPVPASADR